MIVERYTAAPECRFFHVIQQPEFDLKPYGTWVSVPGEDDWYTWCSRTFGKADLAYRHTLELDTTDVLVISTRKALVDFSKRYRTSLSGFEAFPDMLPLDWQRVAADYRGLVIAPWQPQVRMMTWYYTWDCASGVIWDSSALRLLWTVQVESPSPSRPEGQEHR